LLVCHAPAHAGFGHVLEKWIAEQVRNDNYQVYNDSLFRLVSLEALPCLIHRCVCIVWLSRIVKLPALQCRISAVIHSTKRAEALNSLSIGS